MIKEKVFFGTYTRRISEGLYQADLIDGKLMNVNLLSKLGSPTYTKLLCDNNLIYTVDKMNDKGGVAVVDINTGEIKQTILNFGPAPAYLSVDMKHKFLFSGNYHKGTIDVFSMDNSGLLTLVDTFKNEGYGPCPEQDSSHIHFVSLTPDERVVAVDLGTDEVLLFDLFENGKLKNKTVFKVESGFGPRHIRFSSDGKTAYLLGELSSKLMILEYNHGDFKIKQILKTIPEDWYEHNGAAALRVSKDDRFVYVSNRGNNSIAVFDVTGKHAELIQLISTEGDFPRDMAFNFTEDYLVVANQNTDNVSVFSRNSYTGKLVLNQKDFMVPESVRVEFLGE